MVDTLALGASAARHEGSSPFIRTKKRAGHSTGFLFGPEGLNLHVRLRSKLRV